MGSLLRYALRRLAVAVPTLFFAATLIFLLMVTIPGDFVDYITGSEISPAEREQQRKIYQLDKSIPQRYFESLANMVQGKLGYSVSRNSDVEVVIRPRLPITITIATLSLLIALVVSIPLGIASAARRGSKTDLAVSTVAFAGVSIPTFFLAIIVVILLGVHLHILPAGKSEAIQADLFGNLDVLIAPSLVNGLVTSAILTRIARSAMLEILHQDYITTARSKGLTERIVIYKHALRNAVIPIITVAGLIFAHAVGGTVIVEEVFLVPGLGKLMLYAINARDTILVQGAVLVAVAGTVFINLIVDIFYGIIDPRIRY